MSVRFTFDTTRRFRWTPARLKLLRRIYPDRPSAEVARTLGCTIYSLNNRVWLLGLRKTPEYLASPAACRLRRGDEVGKAFRFPKGLVPWNKGKSGYMGANRTSFRNGNYSTRWDREIYCIGCLRISRDDRLEIKLREGLRAWEGLARFVYLTEIGPIPQGAIVRARNGDPDDTRPENLYLSDRAGLMRENTYHNYPKPIARAIQLRGALNRKINRMGKDREHA